MGPFRLLVVAGILLALGLAGCIVPEQRPSPDGGAAAAPVVANVTREHFEGRLLCGVGTSVGTSNPCFSAGGSRNLFAVSTRPDLETLLVGLTWSSTTSLGDELEVLVESRGFHPLESREVRYGSASGKADLVLRIDAADLRGTEWSWENETTPLHFQVRVFPARTTPPTVVAAQDFDLHVLSFHAAPAPEGASPFPRAADLSPVMRPL